MQFLTHAPEQLPLDVQLEAELVVQKARALYANSRFLSGRYASFERLMADPLAGKCMRLAAVHCLRMGAKTRGR